MAIDDHVRRGHPITFGLLTVLAIVELSISAWLTSRFNAHHNYTKTSIRDQARFLLFTSLWTIVFSVLYILLFLHNSSTGSILTSVASHGIFLILTWIFWTSGAAAITASLGGGHDCSTLHYNLPYCNQLNALEGFAWACWIVTTFALAFVLFLGVRATRRGDGPRGQLVSA